MQNEDDYYGQNVELQQKRIVVEFSCPNTNKPLHLGHLRNDAVGMSIAQILAASGAEVRRVNLINDRGIHICKSMLAYQKFGQQITPELAGLKGDHLVGDFYVRFDKWAKTFPGAEEEARQMLKNWEEGDPELKELWKRLNNWTTSGIEETYRKTGVDFDQVYFESDTYLLGRQEVLKGLKKGIFYREGDGSVWVDLTERQLDKKVLLRSDGTSLYLTQDIGTALQRYKDWPFDQMIYVVAAEQKYHFKVLFQVLELLGFDWADSLHHLAYGMVNLPEGKMKSREGTVVDADPLLAELENLAKEEIRERGRVSEIDNLDETAEKIALGALNYYLLQASPYKDMIFDPRESISFSGNTGPYLQYTGARIISLLRKFEQRRQQQFQDGKMRPELLEGADDWEIIKLLASFPETVLLSASGLNPALISGYLFDLSKSFSHYYQEHPVLHNQDSDLVVSRISLARAVLRVLQNGCRLIGVPILAKM
ncbi:Arginine--tRNA ligase [subsurface metagenome]